MIVTRAEFWHRRTKFYKQIREGAIFIYPTDTVYAIGCDATNNQAVLRVRKLKNRNVMPISIVAPCADWVRDACITDESWLARLPGPYTLDMPLKDMHSVAPNVTMGRNHVGVRIPSHWIADVVTELGFPIIGTSANITGQNVMEKLEDLPRELLHGVDFIIYEGEHRGQQSTLVDLTKKNDN
jgi:tRNA threonylcarbamoyl adenosine modification protein (Sua5/YciO/YrdC/YwlC family)